jgi:hypothetical protein
MVKPVTSSNVDFLVMTLTHLHLVLNHVPVLGTAFGLALLAFGIWRRSTELKKTALGVFVLTALMALKRSWSSMKRLRESPLPAS